MEPFSPRRILAATDFSELSTRALRHAVLWAQQYGSELVVLHVQEPIPIPDDQRFPLAGDISELTQAMLEGASQHLAETVRRFVSDAVPVTRELKIGSPPDEIERCASTRGADLVVLGTHGRKGLSRLLLGSVTERTLRIARHPTLIIRPAQTQPAESPPRIRQILCPINNTPVAQAAFEHAASVARAFEARLTVAYAVEEPGTGAERRQGPASAPGTGEELPPWLPAQAVAEFDLQPVVRHGDAAEQMVMLAREMASDLVVIGAQHRRFVDTTVLGVTTVRVTRHAPCPVLVVPQSSDE